MTIPGEMIFDAYRLDMVGRGIKPHSLITYDRAVRLYTEWLTTNGVRAEDAKRAHVQLFLQSTGWAPTTQRTARSYLSAAYEYAVDELELLERNPCRRVRLQRIPQRIPRTVPTRILRELQAGIRSSDDALLFALFAFTGMRTIEVRRLTWNDVSLADNMLRVLGKGDKERLVPIHPKLRAALVGRTWMHGSGHVAAGREGDQVSAAGLHYRMKRIANGHGVRNHDYRRTVATSLRANGVDSTVRDAIMGWTRDTIFDRHYNAVSPQELQRGVLKLYADDPI